MFKPVTSRLDTQIEATKMLENKGVREGDPLPEYPIEPEDGDDEMPDFDPPPPINETQTEDEDEYEMPDFDPPPPIDEAQTEDEDEMPDFDPPPPIDEAQTEDEDEMPDFDPPPSIEQKRKKWDTSANQKELDRQRESLAEERRQSYCVKQKKQTECVSGSARFVKTKNGRTMMKCTCAECGITKTRFVSDNKKTKGRGVGETINKKVGEKIPGFQQAQDLASAIMGATGGDKDLLKRYWSGNIAKGAFNKKNGLFSKKFWTSPSEHQDPSCSATIWDKKSKKWRNTYCD
ncbi:hypothetical protein ACROYT_G028284 [Oculina patagonica]